MPGGKKTPRHATAHNTQTDETEICRNSLPSE
jgi:hypothetical protein